MNQKIKKILVWFLRDRPKIEINYLYFSALLVFLALLSLSRFLSFDTPLFGIPLFFIVQAFGQALLEVGIFLLVAFLLKRWAPRWTHHLFIALCFVVLLAQFADFILARLMDTSIAYPIQFFFGSGAENILTSFQALNLNFTMILIIAAAIILIPLLGLFFYWATHLIADRRPFSLSLNQIALGLGSIFALLFALDLLVHPFLNNTPIYAKYQKALPFKATFISPTPLCIQLPSALAPCRDEKKTLRNIPSLAISRKPNIYLFVIETLRRDFVNPATAPHLTAFGNENIQFPESYSNANSTHLSWFAIFHSNLPYHWTAVRDRWSSGSVPLQFLKKLGYKIRVYSSADLRYFNMDRVVFGPKRELADQIEDYSSERNLEPCGRDALTIDAFSKDIRNKEAKQGNLFIFFLDSTHSEYSFPSDFPIQFAPISKEIDYLSIGPKSPELEFIKNRYRNSIHYVDHLLGRFFELLKGEKLYDKAIIAITGDHGEEFFEEGALFHGTHLNRYQTSVPLYLKFPGKKQKIQTQTATHLDLFPSILNHLTGITDFSSLFDGQSIFAQGRWPYHVAVLHNGPDTPSEFTIEGKGKKLHVRLPQGTSIYDQSSLEIIEMKTSSDDETLDAFIETHFPNALPNLLETRF